MAKPPLEDSWFTTRAMFDDDDLDTVFRLRTAMPGKRVRAQYPVMMIIKWFYPAKKDGMPRQADLDDPQWEGLGELLPLLDCVDGD